jgi:cell wall-associated NlpC family hydrolase
VKITMPARGLVALAALVLGGLVAPAAHAAPTEAATGGVEPTLVAPEPITTAPESMVTRAVLAADRRTATGPAGAPPAVAKAIAAANRISGRPYRWGGGHGRWEDAGYDCSGTVSYVLHHAGLLDVARDSSALMGYGRRGRGRWISVYARGGHAYIVIAGLRFDTSGRGEDGPRWRAQRGSAAGYVVRHPAAL